ncbi:YggU family protein, partial [Candidatus Aerophobetes bacterium]|nr:YggU family protein [Candidatus Aerophobetes bacterium]
NTGATFRVRVQPGVSKNEIVGVQEDALKIRINAPPVKGKANRALIDFLAGKLGVKKSEIEIVSGHTSRIKKIRVLGEGGKIEKNLQRFLLRKFIPD